MTKKADEKRSFSLGKKRLHEKKFKFGERVNDSHENGHYLAKYDLYLSAILPKNFSVKPNEHGTPITEIIFFRTEHIKRGWKNE